MARFLLNPTFDIETGKLLSHDGEFFEEPAILFDRGIAQQAKSQGQQAGTVAGQQGAQANQISSTIIPGLESEAKTPQGYTPTDLNRQLVSGQEAIGGGNAAQTGEGRLAAIRTRTAGGFTPALDEAARIKNQQLASNARAVFNRNADVGLQRQQFAQNALQGLYGTDTNNMLRAMALQQGDLANQMNAAKSGWLQNWQQFNNDVGGTIGDIAGAKRV
jgi:hypothetical protein